MNQKDPIAIGLAFMSFTKQNPKNLTVVSNIVWSFAFIFCGGFMAFQLYQSYFDEKNHYILKTLHQGFACYEFLTTLLFYKLHGNVLRDLLNLDDFWPIDYVSENSKKEQLKFYSFVYNLAMIESVIAVTAVISNLALLIITRYEYYCHYYNNSSPCFELMLLGGIIDMTLQATFINGYNIIFYGFLTVVYCQIKMLKEVFRSIYDEGNIEKRKETFEICIKHHIKLLMYVKNINKAFSFFLLNFVLFTTLIGPILLYIMVRWGNNGPLFILMAYFMTFIPQCIFASLVSSEFESLGDTFYESNWMNYLNPNTRAEVTMVIHRSQIKNDFIAGGIVKINMELITAVVNFSISVYTLLKTV